MRLASSSSLDSPGSLRDTASPLRGTLLLLLTPVVAVASSGSSADGYGSFTTGGTAVTSFVFDAEETGSGAYGGARFYDDDALDLDIEVDCLIVHGNTAIIGGTDADNPSHTYAFKAIDNGGGSPADRITLPQFGQTCSTFSTLSSFALTSGDIDVDDEP
jgi:hypothetical protein